MSDHDDELAEFETSEASIDAMLDAGEPVDANLPPYAVMVTPVGSRGVGATPLPAPDIERVAV